MSTGLIADNYAGLGTGAPVSLDLRPQIANMQTWQNNVDAATGRMSVAQSALTQIQSIAANFYAQLNNVQGVNASAVDSIAASARDALRQVAGLLDTQDGGVYVFAGQDTGNPPVPDPDHITDDVRHVLRRQSVRRQPAWASLDTMRQRSPRHTLRRSHRLRRPAIAVLRLTCPQPIRRRCRRVQVGQNQTETDGTVGQPQRTDPVRRVGIADTRRPAATTGSYMRDVLRALATIGSLSSAQANVPGFQDLVQDTRISLSGGDRCHGAGRRRAGQRAVVAHRHAEPARRHADGADRPGLLGRGGRYGGDAVAAFSGADADAGVVPAHRHAERPVAGEIPAGRHDENAARFIGS